ncbi:hypothetical protein [Puia dinghuensis]|uniref:Uncharacterized protein n=1 Tax=Puia dinghuensis TaxID=1792502 RepID=A0A8J2UJV8_9BACT|nr:hypothetical protein [Puia dinghuensis]GGB26126.1 hypothetical protein GCM10011511_57620 [Puia dinghuensis]
MPTGTNTRPSLIPRLREVKIYFNEKCLPASVASSFFEHYAKTGWLNKAGKPINWKQVAFRWKMRVYHKRPWLYDRKVR